MVAHVDAGMGVFCYFGYIRFGYVHSGCMGRDSGSRAIEVRFGTRSRCCLVAIGVGHSSCLVRGFCWKGRCFDLPGEKIRNN